MTSTSTPPTGQAQSQQQATRQIPGLPPTGLQQQLASMQKVYSLYKTVPGQYGVDVNANAAKNQQSLRSGVMGTQPGQAMAAGSGDTPTGAPMGQTSLQALAQRLASSYGLAVGRDQLVDAQGNFNFTPDQISKSSGGQDTLGTAAAKMNYIASAMQRQQTEGNMKKSEAALQAGLGVTSQRSRGSMVEQQQQFYSGLSNLYQNQDYEAADFSYFIQKEQMDLQAEIMRKIEKAQKRKAKLAFFSGLAQVGVGLYSGNYAMAIQGATTASDSAGDTGYF